MKTIKSIGIVLLVVFACVCISGCASKPSESEAREAIVEAYDLNYEPELIESYVGKDTCWFEYDVKTLTPDGYLVLNFPASATYYLNSGKWELGDVCQTDAEDISLNEEELVGTWRGTGSVFYDDAYIDVAFTITSIEGNIINYELSVNEPDFRDYSWEWESSGSFTVGIDPNIHEDDTIFIVGEEPVIIEKHEDIIFRYIVDKGYYFRINSYRNWDGYNGLYDLDVELWPEESWDDEIIHLEKE